jgi:hypothetical protein
MKTNKPAVIALILWLLFVASNVFAMCKPPYPLKASPPDQIIIIAVGHGNNADGDSSVGIARKRK